MAKIKKIFDRSFLKSILMFIFEQTFLGSLKKFRYFFPNHPLLTGWFPEKTSLVQSCSITCLSKSPH